MLSLQDAQFTPGLHTDSSFTLVQGHLEDEVFKVEMMGSPSAEGKMSSLQALPGCDFFASPIDEADRTMLEEYEK